MKKFLNLIFILFLSNCTMSGSAFLGPTFTGVKTGSIYQTSLSYGSGKILGDISSKVREMNEFKKEKFESLQSLINKQNKAHKLVAQKVHNIEISEIFEEEPLP